MVQVRHDVMPCLPRLCQPPCLIEECGPFIGTNADGHGDGWLRLMQRAFSAGHGRIKGKVGVHRGAETSFDISADLQELARSPVVVVCAGAKAILDLPKTLEVLETLGVPVAGYGTHELPAFWSRDSGLAAPLRLDTPDEIARFQASRTALRLTGGILVTNPLPAEAALPRDVVEGWIDAALRLAVENGIQGKDVTPFLLSAINDLSEGRSLAANRVLIEENARLAAQIAVEMASDG